MDDEIKNEQLMPESGEPTLAMIPCPNCHQPLDVHDYRQSISCPLCDYAFVLYGRTCPNCYHYHEKETAVCHQCGESINRVCRQCHTANWGGADNCGSCGASLDIFERITITTTNRLAQQMSEAAAFKKTEAEASQKRMDEMQAIERERQAEIYHRQQKRQKEERTLMYLTVGILLAVSVIAVFYFILF
jgi:predicted nucleic acid-binding Zn ribbon protein/uncharacterized protein YbaR (Trm112 family)